MRDWVAQSSTNDWHDNGVLTTVVLMNCSELIESEWLKLQWWTSDWCVQNSAKDWYDKRGTNGWCVYDMFKVLQMINMTRGLLKADLLIAC